MKKEILKDGSIYRCLKYCGNCPFKDDGKAINLEDGRVDDIKKYLLKSTDNSFNCHKTVYNLDENMEPTEEQDLKMCYGAYKYLLDNNKLNQQMQLAYRMRLDEDLIEQIAIKDLVINFSLLNNLYNGMIADFEVKDNLVIILQARFGQPYLFEKTKKEIFEDLQLQKQKQKN